MGGGFIEFLFGDERTKAAATQPAYQQQPSYESRRQLLLPMDPQQAMRQHEDFSELARPAFDPRYEKQLVDYHGKESAGTIVVDTPNKVSIPGPGDGTALRYGIGVGRPGFTWSGVKQISARRNGGVTPPPEMLARRPDLPRHMEGGRRTRSAPARCIWDHRSIVSTVPTNPGRSGPTSPPAAIRIA